MARTHTAASGRSPFVTALKWIAYAGLAGLAVLAILVGVAYSQLPAYSDLQKRSNLGQTIRVRAANGAVLVSVGPSQGRWLPYDQIPPEMRAAMISVCLLYTSPSPRDS